MTVLLLLALGSARAKAAVSDVPASSSTASAVFGALGSDYWEALMRLHPLSATFLKHPGYDDRLDDVSPEGQAREDGELAVFQSRLARVDRAALSPSEQVSWDILRLDLALRRKRLALDLDEWRVDQMDGPQAYVPRIIDRAQPAQSMADAEAWLHRLLALEKYYRDHVENLRRGLAAGRAPARRPVERVVAQLEQALASPALDLPYAAPLKRLPKSLAPLYEARAREAVESKVKPALRAYLDFLRTDELPAARDDDHPGLAYLPGGSEVYAYEIRFWTTVESEPGELHDQGLEELRDIHDEMSAVAERAGHKGDLKGFIEKVRSDPRNFFSDRDEILKAAQAVIERHKSRLHEYFGRLPKAPLLVKPVPSYVEKDEAMAYYEQPAADGSRPGVFFINTFAPATRPRYRMSTLAAHEGVPGHHIQQALALELSDLPPFRRYAFFGAYVEGWALYCERLADEMGLYPDDLSRFGMLTDQALRAARLVVDTGLHADGWSRRKAVDFMKENVPLSDQEIETEVDRYIVLPGQALSYKVGQREITSLRKDAQARLGKKFDLRAFHDAVLRNGAVPLPTLRRIVLGEWSGPRSAPLAAVGPAQLLFRRLKRFAPFGRQRAPGAIDVEVQHRHRRAELRAALGAEALLGGALEAPGDFARRAREDARLQIHRVRPLGDALRPPFAAHALSHGVRRWLRSNQATVRVILP